MPVHALALVVIGYVGQEVRRVEGKFFEYFHPGRLLIW
jgi:hypothetical protein